MPCLRSADTIEGREISTAWSIIWSNGGPSVRNKSPQLFCISSSDDWPTFVPRRWSQLKAPSVKRLRLPDAEPQWGKTHGHAHSPIYCHVCPFFPIFILFRFHFLYLSFFPFLSLSLPARLLKAISSFLCCHALCTQFPIVWFRVWFLNFQYILNILEIYSACCI